jgi:hypothetical protein
MARSARLGAFSSVRNSLLGAAACGALWLGGVGCAPGNPGLTVVASLAPTDTCTYDPSGIIFVAQAILDLDPVSVSGGGEARPGYVAQFVVTNSLLNRFNSSYPVMADPNDITVTAAEVELLDTRGSRLAGGFYRTRASGFIDSALGDQPGRGIARVDVIPGSVLSTVIEPAFLDAPEGGGLVTARITLIGVTQSGSEIKSYPYVLPIDVCYGCLYADGVVEEGMTPGCTPGQDTTYILPGFARTPACVDSGECATGACVLGRCVR